jgi:hypothetical protein
MTKLYSLLFVSLFYLGACKTATKAYDKGDYNNAIELAIKKLQKDPSDGETKALLQNAYRFAVDEHQDKIRILSNSTDDSRFEKIYAEYNYLQSLYVKLRQFPALSFVKATDYSSYVETYKGKAADVHFQKGLALMEGGEKDDYRRAYISFKNALRYRSGDAEIRKKMEEAYDLAVVNIIVQPINEYYGGGGYNYTSSYLVKNFENDIIRGLRSQTNNEFVKFYSEWDARSKDVVPDELLDMRLGRMEIGRPYDQTQTRTVSKDVVIKEIVYKPDSVVKQYGKVQAQITTTRRTLVSTGDLHVTSRNNKGLVLWTDIFRGEHTWEVEFATFRGDERALSESDKALLNNNQNNRITPREEEITEAIMRQIQTEMNYRIRNHYNRYY